MRAALLLLLSAAGCSTNPSSTLGSTTDPRTGIAIEFDVDDSCFPEGWLEQYDGKYSPMAGRERDRTSKLVQQAMSAYPAHVLDDNLDIVYCVGTLEFVGAEYGGTNSPTAVYLVNSGRAQGFSDDFLITSFHHEFSSILMRNHANLFDQKAWEKANPPRFKYQYEGEAMYDEFDSDVAYSSEFNEQGLLCSYSATSIEEDFNMFAQGLFSGGRAFWNVVENYPRVEQKMRIIVAFYASLDPSLTEDFFRSLAK